MSIQKSQRIDFKRQKNILINGVGIFYTHCDDCMEDIKVKYLLHDGKIPTGTFAIMHTRTGQKPCRSTIVKIDTDIIPGANDTNRIKIDIPIEDAFGNRYGSYICLCGEKVRFAVKEGTPGKISHKHDRCGLVSELLLIFERKYNRRTDVNDHVIISFDSNYAIMGKIIDYAKGGANIKLSLKNKDHEKLMGYFQRNVEIQVVQYKGDINKSDFPYPYRMNDEDFGFAILKNNQESNREKTTDPNKVYKQGTVIDYNLNEKTNKTELKLKFC